MRRIFKSAGTATAYVDEDLSLFAALLSLLLLAALKNDSSLGEVGDLVTQMVSHPFVALLKSKSIYIFAPVFALSIAAMVFFKSRLTVKPAMPSLLFCALLLYATIRAAIGGSDLGSKVFQGLLIMTLVAVFTGLRRVNRGDATVSHTIALVFFWFSIIIVALNLFTYLSGYGYVGINARFFGTTAHPNFIGAQLAIAAISLTHFSIRASFGKAIAICLLAVASLWLIYCTGSRTAIVIAVTGIYVASWAKLSARAKVGLTAVVLLGIIVAVLSGGFQLGDDEMSVYDRGNTRDAAWSYLVDAIVENPMWGRGYFEGFSEDSWLRGWSTFGVLYFVLMVSAILSGAWRLTARRQSHPVHRMNLSLLLGLLCGLCAGAVFEGYLCDTFSVPVLSVVFVLAAASPAKGRSKATRQVSSKTHLVSGPTVVADISGP
ncbi:O-antigen ligase family protein [Rhizobium halophytocola]|uniref:O-antigen ligase n=1 Tax=Rhizobium halophytocola TaxID=735519 RepID=A0ABS4E3Z6_9HYPH|nr:O-antigen ligase family protein [Rhizobium halophytocola]MBP1852674.1 O-antigen ligase [Rhizobium halophytocola]